MIFFSLGLPGRFADWCDAITARLAERAVGPVELASCNTLEEIGLAAVSAQRDHLIVSARQPSEALRVALAATECPFIMALDDPSLSFSKLVVKQGFGCAAAARVTATSCAMMLGYTLMPGTLVLRADPCTRDPIATAGAIADRLGFRLSAAEIAEIVASFPVFGGDEDVGLDPSWDSIDTANRDMAAGALQAYSDYFNGRGLGEITWSRELFFLGDEPDRTASQVIELEGGIRNLLFGPYIALPPGSWNATVTLAVSKEVTGMTFLVEALAGPGCLSLASTSVAPDERGVCRATLAFSIDPSTDQPLSLRVVNMQPASGGRFALGHVALSLQAAAHIEIPAELSSALGL
jgi:hypothetical protein